jgi:Zn finger protein HypA/HybF involved in hydrogenase expression
MTDDLPLVLPNGHELRGAPAAVATKHHKTATIARALGGPAGLNLQTTTVDTDTLGTFTGETPRPGGPRQTAITKAEWACRETGLDLGIGSEGSFFPHPDIGFITMHTEHVALTQTSTGLTIIGTALDAAPWAQTHTLTPDDDLDSITDKLEQLLASGRQHLIVRPDTASAANLGDGISKGIASTEQLRTAIDHAAAHSDTRRVIIETDLRAHHCPPRHTLILAAAHDLAQRLATRCPTCHSPGFGHQGSRPGAPCAWCGGPTATLLHHVYSCPACRHAEIQPIPGSHAADPGTCPECNP